MCVRERGRGESCRRKSGRHQTAAEQQGRRGRRVGGQTISRSRMPRLKKHNGRHSSGKRSCKGSGSGCEVELQPTRAAQNMGQAYTFSREVGVRGWRRDRPLHLQGAHPLQHVVSTQVGQHEDPPAAAALRAVSPASQSFALLEIEKNRPRRELLLAPGWHPRSSSAALHRMIAPCARRICTAFAHRLPPRPHQQ